MKAITIWQPWASLLACGEKQFETRPWATSYRGPIAIHASAKSIGSIMKECFPLGEWSYAPDYQAKKDFLCEVREALKIDEMDELPFGAVIATAELVGCHKMVLHGGRGPSADGPGWLETDHGIYEPDEHELLFGDWTPGRYAWEIANVKMLETPIPAKGRQGIWNWDNAQAIL